MARTRFHSLLEVKVKEEVNNTTANLADGKAPTYEKYQWLVGYIKGLNTALKLADEVEEDLE